MKKNKYVPYKEPNFFIDMIKFTMKTMIGGFIFLIMLCFIITVLNFTSESLNDQDDMTAIESFFNIIGIALDTIVKVFKYFIIG